MKGSHTSSADIVSSFRGLVLKTGTDKKFGLFTNKPARLSEMSKNVPHLTWSAKTAVITITVCRNGNDDDDDDGRSIMDRVLAGRQPV